MKRCGEAAGAACVLVFSLASEAGAQTPHMKINCGFNSYTPAGWEDDDAYVSGGVDFENWPNPIDATGVTNAAPDDVYKTVRHVSTPGEPHTYTIPVPNGNCIVRLHFCDGSDVPALRDTKYVMEDTTVLDHMNYADKGGHAKAFVMDFNVTVTDGDIVIECSSYSGSDVFEAGIEIILAEPPELNTVRVTPDPAYCLPSGTLALTAETLDQYGQPFAATVTWTVSGGGQVSPATGTASTFASDGSLGDFTVTATGGTAPDTVSAEVTVKVAAPELTTIRVTPETAVIAPIDGTQEFTAEALDQFGDPIAADVTWSADAGGTVEPAVGAATTFTSDGTLGAFTVTASSGGVTATATVTVESDAALAEIVVTPETVIVEVGRTVQLTAQPKDQYGDAFPAALTWTVSGGGTLFPETGLATIFTSGDAPGGPFTVTAASGTVAGTASVTVTTEAAPGSGGDGPGCLAGGGGDVTCSVMLFLALLAILRRRAVR